MSSFREELRVKPHTCIDEASYTPLRYHCARTSFSFGCSALDNAQKWPFQWAPTGVCWHRDDNPAALSPAGEGYMCSGPWEQCLASDTAPHTLPQKNSIAMFLDLVLKFKLIFSFHVHSWEKEAESRRHR